MGNELDIPSIIVITGPTASGKSALTLALAKLMGTEIVNADSVQIYKDFDIGSAKPSAAELAEVPHHLVSTLDPTESFDAGRFRELAGKAITEICSRGLTPIVSGGTGLYLRALLGGLIDVEIAESALSAVEDREERCSSLGEDDDEITDELRRWLVELDPPSADSLPRDPQRVRRALLVMLSTGKSIGELQHEHQHRDQRYRALILCLLPERERLYRAINARVDRMLEAGFAEEVKALSDRYPAECRAFGAIGYRHLRAFLEGSMSPDEAVELLKRDTRRFAKRQRTWWRHQPEQLGWTRTDLGASDWKTAVGAEQIAQRLYPEIDDFLQRKSRFTESKVYFSPLEDLNFG